MMKRWGRDLNSRGPKPNSLAGYRRNHLATPALFNSEKTGSLKVLLTLFMINFIKGFILFYDSMKGMILFDINNGLYLMTIGKAPFSSGHSEIASLAYSLNILLKYVDLHEQVPDNLINHVTSEGDFKVLRYDSEGYRIYVPKNGLPFALTHDDDLMTVIEGFHVGALVFLNKLTDLSLDFANSLLSYYDRPTKLFRAGYDVDSLLPESALFKPNSLIDLIENIYFDRFINH